MLEVLIILLCLALNAFLSMFEMAFVSVRKSRLEYLAKQGRSSAGTLLKLRTNPERTLSVIQIGITLVGAIAAAVGGAGAEESLTPIYENYFGFREGVSEFLAIATVVAPITYLSVVIGELVPKSLALRHATPIALFAAPILRFLDKSLSPIVSILERSTKIILIPFQKDMEPTKPEGSQEESIELDAVSPESRQSLINLSKLEKKSALETMRPWNEVVFIHPQSPAEEIKALLVEKAYTRLPVFDGENVVGILHTKEFLALADFHNWQRILRPPLHVQKLTPLTRVLSTLQKNKRHMAIVLDEFKAVGIVTIEDIIEEVFGDVDDERDEASTRSLLARRGRNPF